MTSASARGLATLTFDGTVLDVWFPSVYTDKEVAETGTVRLEETPQQFAALVGPDEERGVARVAVETSIKDLDEAPVDAYDVYLRLHLLSHRAVKPHGLNMDGIFGLLTNVVWTNYGPCAVADFQMVRGRLASRGPVVVFSVDKFPRMVDYVVPSGVRIGDADRVRLGAHLAEGTTVMHEGFVNFNAGTLGASIMGTLSGGGEEVISLGERCLLGANSGVGISLGDDCVVEAGLYVTAGTKVTALGKVADAAGVADGDTVKAGSLSGASGILFRRNSITGAVEASEWKTAAVELNADLHKN